MNRVTADPDMGNLKEISRETDPSRAEGQVCELIHGRNRGEEAGEEAVPASFTTA